jgi:uncharacterized protein
MTFLKFTYILSQLIISVAIIVSCQGNSQKETIQNLPISSPEVSDSLPKPVGYVNDFDHLFTPSEQQFLDSLLKDLNDRTTIQIAIVTLDTFMIKADSFDTFTLRLANAWGVGQKEKNNGILIGISKGYRIIRIQNGKGIENILSDSQTKQIIDTAFIPHFRKSQYFDGTVKGVNTLMKALKE